MRYKIDLAIYIEICNNIYYIYIYILYFYLIFIILSYLYLLYILYFYNKNSTISRSNYMQKHVKKNIFHSLEIIINYFQNFYITNSIFNLVFLIF